MPLLIFIDSRHITVTQNTLSLKILMLKLSTMKWFKTWQVSMNYLQGETGSSRSLMSIQRIQALQPFPVYARNVICVLYLWWTNPHSEFYFNYASSILGELKPTLTSGSSSFPFLHFIATPLLPCGKMDSKVRKFTGNKNFGNATDNLTRAIHDFVHFSVVYSNGYILFCDMQGELSIFHSTIVLHINGGLGCLDTQGVMCLFDPQEHTWGSNHIFLIDSLPLSLETHRRGPIIGI